MGEPHGGHKQAAEAVGHQQHQIVLVVGAEQIDGEQYQQIEQPHAGGEDKEAAGTQRDLAGRGNAERSSQRRCQLARRSCNRLSNLLIRDCPDRPWLATAGSGGRLLRAARQSCPAAGVRPHRERPSAHPPPCTKRRPATSVQARLTASKVWAARGERGCGRSPSKRLWCTSASR